MFQPSVSLRNGPEFQSRVPAALRAPYFFKFTRPLPMVWGVLYGRERLQCVFVSFAFKGMLAFESFRRYANPVQNICSHSGDEGADAHFIPAVQV